jgi:hypothetical protein
MASNKQLIWVRSQGQFLKIRNYAAAKGMGTASCDLPSGKINLVIFAKRNVILKAMTWELLHSAVGRGRRYVRRRYSLRHPGSRSA